MLRLTAGVLRRSLFIIALLAALASGRAHANGRFPVTNGVVFRPGNATEILLRTTFGVLYSFDDGAHFHWVCEQAIGYAGTFDPTYAIATDGTIYVATMDGVRVSRDQGCTYKDVSLTGTDPPTMMFASDLTLGPSDEVWTVTGEGSGNDIYESTDAGAHWGTKGLATTTISWRSVRVAHSDAKRVYVTGNVIQPPGIEIRRTLDGGGQWDTMPTTDIVIGSSKLVTIAAVSPTNPDILFARSEKADPPMGDKLYRSIDGAQSWQLVLDTTDMVRDVVFRSDGSILVATQKGGVFLSTDGGGTFPAAPATQPEMECAGQRSDGTMFACGANWDPDNFALGRSSGVGPWTKVMRFVEITGPLSCPAGTVQHDTCELSLWPALKEQFGIVDPVVDAQPAPPDATGSPPAKGCCETSDAGGGSALVLIGVVLFASRRRWPSPRSRLADRSSECVR